MTADIVIRHANPDDQNVVRALVQTIADETFGQLFAPSPVPIDDEDWTLSWLAISDTTIVGVVLTDNEWISDLWVIDTSRGLGVGKKLLRRAEAEIASRGHHACRLRVVKSNDRAVQFYLRQDWKIAREFPHEKFHHPMLEMIKSV